MATFFTADQHFGHANILIYEADSRKNDQGETFYTVEQMDEAIVDRWNSVVGPDDTVYSLGDFSYKLHTIAQYLPYLNGRVVLVCGNHDPFFKRCATDRVDEARELAIEAGFADLHMQHVIEIEGVGKVKLSHFPYLPPTPDDELYLRYESLRPKPNGEALLLHGHIHSQWMMRQYRNLPPMLNVGVDMHEMKPISEHEIKRLFATAGAEG